MEPITSTLHEPHQSSDDSFSSSLQLPNIIAAHSTQDDIYSWLREKIRNLENIPFAELLSTKRAGLAEAFHGVLDEASFMYHYIQGPALSPSARRARSEKIAALAGMRYEEVSARALMLEETVLRFDRLTFVISEITSRCAHYLWQHYLLDLWRAKLAIGFAFLIWGCVYKVWMGRRLEAAGIAIAVLLFWPLCALLHPVIVGSKE